MTPPITFWQAVWQTILNLTGIAKRRCLRDHAEHHESRQVFYDGSRIVWCRKCHNAYWRGLLLLGSLSPLLLFPCAAQVLLEWNPSPSSNLIAGYRIHYGPAPRTNSDPALFRYPFTNTYPKTTLSALLTNLAAGPWYFSATAIATNGLASLYTTNELAWTNSPAPPASLRLAGPVDALILQSAPGAAGPWKTLAVVTSSNQPLQLTAAPKQMFRALSTNLPPLPR